MSLLKQSLRAFAAGVAVCCTVYALAAPPAESRVTIDNFTFKPDVITVPIGTRIVWENDDDIPHSIVETQGKFHSPVLDRRQIRLHLRHRRQFRIFLRPASPHEGQGRGHTVKAPRKSPARLGAHASAWLSDLRVGDWSPSPLFE
jgi:plastocyanin